MSTRPGNQVGGPCLTFDPVPPLHSHTPTLQDQDPEVAAEECPRSPTWPLRCGPSSYSKPFLGKPQSFVADCTAH